MMQYVPFGKPGFNVSRFGMGAMRLPMIPASDGKMMVDEDESIRMIRYGVDHGINYFDTAYLYHGGKSEITLGKALLDGYRERVKIATKLPSSMYDDPQGCIDEQMSKLQVDHIDVYLLHGLNKSNWAEVKEKKLLSFLDRLKSDGRITWAGFSFHDGVGLFKEIIDAYDWDIAQIQLNYVDVKLQAGVEGLKYAAAKGVPIAVMEPLKGGALTQNIPEEVQDIFDTAHVSRTPVEWALRWIANFPETTVVLSGVSSMEQLKENIGIFDEPLIDAITPEDAEIISRVKEIYDEKIKVGCTACGYCMPCPSGVSIPNVFRYYNSVAIGGDRESFRNSYDAFLTKQNADASLCIECGECETACPQNLPIIRQLKDAHALLA